MVSQANSWNAYLLDFFDSPRHYSKQLVMNESYFNKRPNSFWSKYMAIRLAIDEFYFRLVVKKQEEYFAIHIDLTKLRAVGLPDDGSIIPIILDQSVQDDKLLEVLFWDEDQNFRSSTHYGLVYNQRVVFAKVDIEGFSRARHYNTWFNSQTRNVKFLPAIPLYLGSIEQVHTDEFYGMLIIGKSTQMRTFALIYILYT